MHLRAAPRFLAILLASGLSPVLGLANAWGQANPESVKPVQMPGPASDVEIRVPVGLDVTAPVGANMTDGLADSLSAGAGSGEPPPGSGEWVFVPIPFKNALLGAGLQVGAGRLYKPADKPAQKDASVFGVGGMYAEGGSWAAAVGDRRYWGESARVRSTLAVGAGEANYPIELILGQRLPVKQQFQGGTFALAWKARDKLWLTAGYRYAATDISIGKLQSDEDTFLVVPQASINLAQVRLKADWDSRSNEFYPTHGALVSGIVDVADGLVGSDRDYVTLELSLNRYYTLNEHNVLAWRIAGKTVSGDPPFFALPWFGSGVDLRGYTPGRYIGKRLAAAQAEWRWQATKRIGFVAFGGVGGVWGDVPVFDQEDFLPAGGVGLRWRLTQKFRVNFRIDYAWGKDDEVLLISVGEAF